MLLTSKLWCKGHEGIAKGRLCQKNCCWHSQCHRVFTGIHAQLWCKCRCKVSLRTHKTKLARCWAAFVLFNNICVQVVNVSFECLLQEGVIGEVCKIIYTIQNWPERKRIKYCLFKGTNSRIMHNLQHYEQNCKEE